jgi:hypothetical protein
MGWWDLKVKCVLATGMTVLNVSLTVGDERVPYHID